MSNNHKSSKLIGFAQDGPVVLFRKARLMRLCFFVIKHSEVDCVVFILISFIFLFYFQGIKQHFQN